MASIRDQNTRHANRCRIVVNGTIIAEGTSVTVNEGSNPQGIYTINNAYAHEHAHTQVNARVTIGKLVWRSAGLRSLNIGNGPITNLPTFDVQGMDDIDAAVLFVARTCTIADRSMTINANQPINSNVSINAIRIEDGQPATGGGGNAPGGAGGQQPTP